MKLIIDIPEDIKNAVDYMGLPRISTSYLNTVDKAIQHGTLLPKYIEELKRQLFMEVDGGTDDKYLRYADVCDRISNTIDTYINERRK